MAFRSKQNPRVSDGCVGINKALQFSPKQFLWRTTVDVFEPSSVSEIQEFC